MVLWPIPMPYPEVFCSGKFTADGWRPSVASAYNWLWLGRPSTAPGALRFGRKLKQRQWRVVKLLESLAEDGNSPLQVDAAMMGRVASKAENADKELASLHRAAAVLTGQGSDKMYSRLNSGLGGLPSDAEYDDFRFGVFEGCLKQEKFVAAKPVEADRLTFVGTPQFDPSDLFDQRTYEVYADPLQHAVVDENFEPPLVKILATPDEKVKLLRKLATTGRLLLLSEQECDMKYSAGLFSVVKDLSKDRLILDARPSNGRERAVGTWTSTLASPSTLAQIELLPGEILLRSGQDLRDYFYQFRVTADRARRNCLAGVLGRSEIDAIFGVDARPELTTGVAALNTLAMGDCSACDFAQGAHLMLLLTCNAAFVPELLLGRKPPPRGLLSIGAVIDDLVMLERVLKRDLQQIKEGAVKTQADGRIKRALDGYSRAHLETNPKKAFHNTPLCSFWGIELDGERGVIRPSSSRLLLIGITFRVCCLGLATCSLLQSLAGSWISVFLVRRRTMSSMNLIFDAIGCSENGGQVIRLSEELIDELFTYCFLGSLCCGSTFELRPMAPFGPLMLQIGVWLESALNSLCRREFCRHAIQKSVWSQLLPPSKAWLRAKGRLEEDDELPDEKFDCHPLFEILARCIPYKETWRQQHKKQVHINIGELRAHLREESYLAPNSMSSRQLYGLDSQVSLGCLIKGRSSSKSLNQELLRSLPIMVGSDLYGFYMYYPSKLNRADGPTRKAPPPPPDKEKPHW